MVALVERGSRLPDGCAGVAWNGYSLLAQGVLYGSCVHVDVAARVANHPQPSQAVHLEGHDLTGGADVFGDGPMR